VRDGEPVGEEDGQKDGEKDLRRAGRTGHTARGLGDATFRTWVAFLLPGLSPGIVGQRGPTARDGQRRGKDDLRRTGRTASTARAPGWRAPSAHRNYSRRRGTSNRPRGGASIPGSLHPGGVTRTRPVALGPHRWLPGSALEALQGEPTGCRKPPVSPSSQTGLLPARGGAQSWSFALPRLGARSAPQSVLSRSPPLRKMGRITQSGGSAPAGRAT
jgi:hypothetical protein